ncbi:MOSC domain-containing protein [Luteitalea pratensis]|nr:MOSC domain-containing protein [Luteitalea pratensis]
MDELRASVGTIRQAPSDNGTVALVVRRPDKNQREVLDEGHFDQAEGLAGDTWRLRQSSFTPDGAPHPDTQLTVMGVRAIGAISPDETRWPLAGDQLFVDLDLTYANLPPGTRLQIGEAVLEVTEQLHTGCGKFVERFGLDAMKWVNSPEGRELNLRGIYAKVVTPGRIRPGDTITKVAALVP